MGISKNLLRSEILVPSNETRKMSKKTGGVARSYVDGFFVKSDEVDACGAKLQPKEVFRDAHMAGKIHTAYVSLGSNIGNRIKNCHRAIELISKDKNISVKKSSPWYESQAIVNEKPVNQPSYLNAVSCIETPMAAEQLLEVLLTLENTMGRPYPRSKNEPRIIDLDLLLFDNLVLNSNRLTVPHPELAKRLFVLLPLCDIAPTLVHPTLGLPISVLADRCRKNSYAEHIEMFKEP